MNYTSAVSIIPGGCPQFLDCRLDAKSLGRFWSYFREVPQSGESAIATSRRPTELVPVPVDDAGQPGDYDYKIDAIRALETFEGRWVPVPFLRLSNEQWKDGSFTCEKGPSNWVRLHVSRDEGDVYRLTFLFDTTIEEREQPTGQYFALCADDVAENARFALSPKSRDNAWFLNTLWVDEWLAEIYDAHQTARHNGRTGWRENTPFIMEHLATYLTLLESLAAGGTVPTVRVVDPAHLTPVDVDLVLDLGNSRSTGMLVETLPQRQTNLNDSYLLQIRDLSRPDRAYTDPFATRIEFAEATFGNSRLSARSGRSTPAFVWPSVVRVGPEAARLAQHSVGAEGNTGMSSPKRYLWDESPRAQQWRFNAWGTGSELEPPVTRGVFIQQINREGTPLACFENAGVSPRPKILRTQQPDVAFEAHFTRSSTMMFLLSEIIMHALVTINSPAQRSEREQPDVPRRLKRIIFTVPSAMPIAEQQIYRRWVTWAVRMIWQTLGWGEWYTTKQGLRDTRPDYRVSPDVRCSWDEATCTQLVYLYNEITEKFQGDARRFFELMGRERDAEAPSLRIANVDIGGGTIDLSVTTFAVTGDEATAARIRPHMEFRDGFNIAGDDVIREIVEQHILPCIGKRPDSPIPATFSGSFSAATPWAARSATARSAPSSPARSPGPWRRACSKTTNAPIRSPAARRNAGSRTSSSRSAEPPKRAPNPPISPNTRPTRSFATSTKPWNGRPGRPSISWTSRSASIPRPSTGPSATPSGKSSPTSARSSTPATAICSCSPGGLPSGTRSSPASSPNCRFRRTGSCRCGTSGWEAGIPSRTTGAKSRTPRPPWWSGRSSAPSPKGILKASPSTRPRCS